MYQSSKSWTTLIFARPFTLLLKWFLLYAWLAVLIIRVQSCRTTIGWIYIGDDVSMHTRWWYGVSSIRFRSYVMWVLFIVSTLRIFYWDWFFIYTSFSSNVRTFPFRYRMKMTTFVLAAMSCGRIASELCFLIQIKYIFLCIAMGRHEKMCGYIESGSVGVCLVWLCVRACSRPRIYFIRFFFTT